MRSEVNKWDCLRQGGTMASEDEGGMKNFQVDGKEAGGGA